MKKILMAVCIAGCAMTAQADDILGDVIKGTITVPDIGSFPPLVQSLGRNRTITAEGNTFMNSPSLSLVVDPTTITFNIISTSSFNAGTYITLTDLSGDFPAAYSLVSSSAGGLGAGNISTVGNTFVLDLGEVSYGTGGQAIFRLTAAVSPVPEPESLALLLAGLGLVGSIAGRRRRGVARPDARVALPA